MASRPVIVADMLREFGKDTPAAMAKIDQIVGDVTIDLLSQNEGRFKKLSRSATLTFVTDQIETILPADFNSIKQTFAEVDSEGKFIAECHVLAKAAVFRRLAEGRYAGYRLAHIEEQTDDVNGPGYYLVVADAPSETKYFSLDYYRKPTGNDTDIITNVDAIKNGIRSRVGEWIGKDQSSYYQEIYFRMRSGFAEEPEKTVTDIVTEPNRRVARHNQKMHNIGSGG